MKKKTAAIIIAALVITLGGTTAFAFGHSSSSDIKNQRTVSGVSSDIRYNRNSVCSYCKSTGHCFHDSDGDGICDYYKTDTSIGNTGAVMLTICMEPDITVNRITITITGDIMRAMATDTGNQKRGVGYAQ